MTSTTAAENQNAKRMQDVYPRYSRLFIETLLDDYLEDAIAYLGRTGRASHCLADSFATHPLSQCDEERIEGKKVVCMSMHFKASNIGRRKCHPLTDEHGQILLSELQTRGHRAWESTQRADRTFFENYLDKVLASDFKDWVPVVYLAHDLNVLEPVFKERGWIVIRSLHSSLAHCPGAMWRYLGFNLNSRCCYMQDTDRFFARGRAERLVRIMEQHPDVALVRPLQWTSQGGEMSPILGNDFVVRPSNIDFDAGRMMLGYLVLNILHEDRLTNFVHEPKRGRDDLSVEPMSKRLRREHFGPLVQERVPNKNYPYYAFDEQWLREFVYYHLVGGTMATLLQNVRDSDPLQTLDLTFQRAAGNLVVSEAAAP